MTAEDVTITGITADSRAVKKGYLFICIRGGSADGHLYAADAVRAGAAAVIAEYAPPSPEAIPQCVPVIITEDTRSAAAHIWSAWYGGDETGSSCGTRLIAVTGTNGKTSVTHMLKHILCSAGYDVGIIGTVEKSFGHVDYDNGDGMTTPPPEYFYRDIWDMRRRGADFIVFEASSHGIAQKRLDGLGETGCRLALAAFTNLSPEHMDYHRDMEDYFRVKSRLFTEYKPEISIINTDDKYGARIYNICRRKSLYGTVIGTAQREAGINAGTEPADSGLWMARRPAVYGAHGIEYTFSSPRAVFRVRCPVPGAYTVYNTLQALSCALALGVDPVTAEAAIGVFCGVRGRMECVKCDTTKFSQPVFIDFAHTPAALSGTLSSIRATAPDKRIVLLFGCGGDRDKKKRAEMGKIASRAADFVIITSDNSRSERAEDIISDIESGFEANGARYIVIKDRAEAIEYAVMNAQEDDLLLLAGKGHEEYEDSGGVKRPFDERELVFAAIENRYRKI